MVSGLLVLIGVFTPYSAAAITIGTVGRQWYGAVPSQLLQGTPAIGILVVLGIAVTLLGPGLFSLDFRLFGRREIVIPRRARDEDAH